MVFMYGSFSLDETRLLVVAGRGLGKAPLASHDVASIVPREGEVSRIMR